MLRPVVDHVAALAPRGEVARSVIHGVVIAVRKGQRTCPNGRPYIMKMFDITGDDIAALSDGDLRTLISLLCEADLRRRNLPSAAVTAGGNQDAIDGGVDVRVALPPGTLIEGFVPRSATVFQIKKPDMPRKAIITEMRPGGTLRPAIVQQSENGGAYIIVSSGAHTSDLVLKNRKAAMKEALHDLANADRLAVDFYDRGRVATWLRDHPGLIPWVRERIGRSLSGWKPFGRWSQPAGADPTYLLDEATRVRTGAWNEGNGLSAAEGINRMRGILYDPGKAVRLVGLSGVGKTRLVEALFDPDVGDYSLDPSMAFYADAADSLDPSPPGLASDLIARRIRAILAIDNCTPEMHRRLTEIVKADGSTVSLLTVEYDIQDDEPEGTDVFVLDTSSAALIEQLVARRFPSLSQVDAPTIAGLSGGNARVALALAEVAPKSGTVASIGDRVLFRRLFEQRETPDASLLPIAQACSLLYSFEGETLAGEVAELPILGSLIGRTADEVYTAAIKLKRRQLVQARGPWRAVLPHAVANRLAAAALQEIPRSRLMAALVENASERVLRSFSQRLGYLDASLEAREIVASWLAPGGLVADIGRLNDLGIAVLKNVAPVAPEAALGALEGAIREADDAILQSFAQYARLLRSLAYEPAHFERAVALLVRLSRLPNENRLMGDIPGVLESLFPVRLSGTEAPLELRLTVIDGLLRYADEAEQRLGVKLLRAVLRTDFFTSGYSFDFGARCRGYGLQPRNGQQVREWFAASLEYAGTFLLIDGAVGDSVRDVVAQSFRGLWVQGGQAAILTRHFRAVVDARGFWYDGWGAVRRTRIYGSEQLSPEELAELGGLEDALRPRTAADKVRSVVLHGSGFTGDLDDPDEIEGDMSQAFERQAASIARLAREVIVDEAAWRALIPEIAVGSTYKVGLFGEGLAQATDKPRDVWDALVAETAATPRPGISALCGFLKGVEQRDRALAGSLLDQALDDPILAPWLPILQTSTTFDEAALSRLQRALASGIAPVKHFSRLAYGGESVRIGASELRRLLLAIAEVPGGNAIARQILQARFFLDRNDNHVIDADLVDTGRTLLSGFQFERGRPHGEDYELALLVRVSLAGEAGQAVAQEICGKLMLAMARYEVNSYEYDDMIHALFETHPTTMLNTLFSGDEISHIRSAHMLNELPRTGKLPMSTVPDNVVLDWCECMPTERYALAAKFVPLSAQVDDEVQTDWTKLVGRLLSDAPDPVPVFEAIIERLRPTSWSGSLADAFASRLELLNRLDIEALPALAASLEHARAAFEDRIERERQREQAEERERYSRFE